MAGTATVPTDRADPPIGPGPAIAGYLAGWSLGPLLAAGLVLAAVNGGLDDPSIPSIVAGTTAGWVAFVAVLWWLSTRFGTADPRADYAVLAKPIDLLAVPAGVLTQLVLLPALYYPLQQWWPDTFSDAELERRAEELVDKAGGVNTVLLVLMVAIGAPIVEELVYRGLLQRSLGRALGAVPSLLVVSAVFAIIHFSPVEIPGLFLAGLVFGGGFALTGRLGPALLAHAAFNATALAVLLS